MTTTDSSFGQDIDALRGRISRRALMRALPPERHTLLADLLAHHTLDRLSQWVDEADDRSIATWLEGIVRDHPSAESLLHLLAATVSATLDLLAEGNRLTQHIRDRLCDIQQRIDYHAFASRSKNAERHLTVLDLIDARLEDLVGRLSAQDTITAEHSRSVAMWCSRIAKRLSMTREDAVLVTRSGLIHDIGKISTPAEILSAPRQLTDDEWNVMKQHSMEGVRILEPISELRSLVPAVRWHHERYDGRGYPDGIGAGDLPFTARVVAVADAFNAMIARRPYRAPLSPAVAIEELKRHSGTQFDAAIVDAMIDVVSRRSG